MYTCIYWYSRFIFVNEGWFRQSFVSECYILFNIYTCKIRSCDIPSMSFSVYLYVIISKI